VKGQKVPTRWQREAAKQIASEGTELWERRKLGNHSPQVLIQTIWWLLIQHFGLRGRQEHHTMQTEDFSFGVDENGAE